MKRLLRPLRFLRGYADPRPAGQEGDGEPGACKGRDGCSGGETGRGEIYDFLAVWEYIVLCCIALHCILLCIVM